MGIQQRPPLESLAPKPMGWPAAAIGSSPFLVMVWKPYLSGAPLRSFLLSCWITDPNFCDLRVETCKELV